MNDCPGHGWNIWSTGTPPAERSISYCDGSCAVPAPPASTEDDD